MRDDYPYLIQGHMYQYDLHWIVENIQNIWKDIDASVELHTIKYADPIQWDITTQYQANTVVADPKTGTAYISTKPVPSGILLTDTNYWTVVFNFQKVYTDIMKNISKNYEEGKTATVNLKTFDLVWVDDILYYALHNINIGDAYVPDANIKQTTVEKMLAISFKNNMLNFIGEDRTTTLNNDILNVSGDWTVNAGDITHTSENSTITSQEMLLDSKKFNGIFEDIKMKMKSKSFPIYFEDKSINLYDDNIINVKDYGVKGDGIADDTEAIQNLINKYAPAPTSDLFHGATLFFPEGIYSISKTIQLPGYVTLRGSGIGKTLLHLKGNSNCPMIDSLNFDAFHATHEKKWFYPDNVPNRSGIEHMTLFGSRWNNTYPGLIRFYGSAMRIYDVMLYGFDGWAIYQDFGDEDDSETWKLNVDKMSENIISDCYIFEGKAGIYQSPRANDVIYNNVLIGRIDEYAIKIDGSSYWTYFHAYDANKTGNAPYACEFNAMGQINGVIESMHIKPAALLNGWYQQTNLEFYRNEYMNVQIGGEYSNINIKIDDSTAQNEKTSVYITEGAKNCIFNIVKGGDYGTIDAYATENSIFEIVSEGDIKLGLSKEFKNCSGNAIGKTVNPGAGVSNVWYNGKP